MNGKPAILAASALAVLLLGGCGGGGTQSAAAELEDLVKDAVEQQEGESLSSQPDGNETASQSPDAEEEDWTPPAPVTETAEEEEDDTGSVVVETEPEDDAAEAEEEETTSPSQTEEEAAEETEETNATADGDDADLYLWEGPEISEPLWRQHWHLHADEEWYGAHGVGGDAHIDIGPAWNVAMGKGATVAIIDSSGYDTDHEDLAYVSAISAGAGGVAQGDISHGTMIAGVLGARENGKGMIGVAPEARMVFIKEDGVTVSSVIEAFRAAEEAYADVISCSWGSHDVPDAIRSVIDDLAENGRDGKGTVIVFASGNEGCNLDEPCEDPDTGDMFMSNDEAMLESVIAVGATDRHGLRTGYSNYGSFLDVVAPAGEMIGLIATDPTGTKGYADGSYLYADDPESFIGTSASAPVVAGVAALMISANNRLTADDVRNIFIKTADKVGSLPYIDGRNDEYGYGKVNAGAAVAKAKNYR